MKSPKTVKTPIPPTTAIAQRGIRLLVSAIKILNNLKVVNID